MHLQPSRLCANHGEANDKNPDIDLSARPTLARSKLKARSEPKRDNATKGTQEERTRRTKF